MRIRFDEQLEQLNEEMINMGNMIEASIGNAVKALMKQDEELAKKTMAGDEKIDRTERKIEDLCLRLLLQQQPVARDLRNISSALKMVTDMERIGDHAVNICDYTKLIEEKHIVFSDDAKQQMEEMKMICEKMFHNISKVPEDTQEWLQKVHDSENFIDQKTEEFYESHLERINRGECNDEACIIFSEMLTDFERIGDHTWNVAKQMAKIIERG